MNENLYKWMNSHREFISPSVFKVACIQEDYGEIFLLEDQTGVQEFVYSCGDFHYANFRQGDTISNIIAKIIQNISAFGIENYTISVNKK